MPGPDAGGWAVTGGGVAGGGWTDYLNPFWSERHLLRSPFGPEECAERLRGRVMPTWSWRRLLLGPGDARAWGSVSSRGFRIGKSIRSHNGFQTIASGRFRPDPMGSAGTVLEVRLGLPRGAILTWLFWLGILGLVAVLLSVGVLHTRADAGGAGRSLAGGLVPWAVPVLFFAVLGWCRWFARDEGAFLLWMLTDVLRAQEVPPEEAAVMPR